MKSIIAFLFLGVVITPIFLSQKSEFIKVKVIHVYDGDTFTVNIENWLPIVGEKMPVRVSGIDAPELSDDREHIHKLAIEARDFLRKYLTDKDVRLINVKRDKYFRLNADVMVNGENLKDVMIDNNLAKPYNGKKKPVWD